MLSVPVAEGHGQDSKALDSKARAQTVNPKPRSFWKPQAAMQKIAKVADSRVRVCRGCSLGLFGLSLGDQSTTCIKDVAVPSFTARGVGFRVQGCGISYLCLVN